MNYEDILKAAQQGHTEAQFNLGQMYYNDQVVQQDYAEVVNSFIKAAEQEDENVQFCLGMMYEEGKVVPLDYVEAAKWYRKAAEQGHTDAQLRLYKTKDNNHSRYNK